jgi:hypothetical protein
MPRKPANKVSKGRTPKPAANNIKSVIKSEQKGRIRDLQNRLSAVRNKLPVGANANNAVFNRGNMMGGKSLKGIGASGAVLHAASPFVDKFGIAMGKKLGNSVLKPVGRAIDKAMGTKPKKRGK